MKGGEQVNAIRTRDKVVAYVVVVERPWEQMFLGDCGRTSQIH